MTIHDGKVKEMKHLKVIRLKTKLLKEEEIELLLCFFKKANKGKIKFIKKNINEYINIENIFEDFLALDKVNALDLDIIEKLIIICKIMYSNGKDIVNDRPYDLTLNKFKEFRDEPIIERLQIDETDKVTRRTHDVEHEFPELKGTLDKTQKIYTEQITSKNEKALEPFVRKCFEIADTKLTFKISKKYDGNSVVLTVKNGEVLSAVTRGEDGKGADLTHLFKDVTFLDDNKKRGVQFELIITKEDFEDYCEAKGVEYDNLRTAVTSILTSSDAVKYAKYLTAVPLNTSDNISENDLNYYYSKKVEYEFIKIKGNGPIEILEKIEEYANDIISTRDNLNYAIDGVVIECLDDKVKDTLGRKNNINQYQIAYKFPPQVRYTKVKDLKFTVGRTGIIVPMVYYDAVYFNGGKHTHSSLSSFERFERLNLKYDDIIMITYNGDVMPYVSKYECEENDNNNNSYLYFPHRCKCGYKLERLGANYYCNNPLCSSKQLPAIAHLYSTLGIRDMKEKKVKRLLENKIITGLSDALRPDYKALYNVEGFNEKSIRNFKEQISKAEDTKIDEARLMKALGVCGERIARSILSVIPLDAIIEDNERLYKANIGGIKEKTKGNFCKKLVLMKHIIDKVRKQLIVKEVKVDHDKVMICFTGFRNKKLKELLELMNFEVVDKYKKKVSYVLIPKEGHESATVKSAKKDNKQILTLEEFKNTFLKDMEVDM